MMTHHHVSRFPVRALLAAAAAAAPLLVLAGAPMGCARSGAGAELSMKSIESDAQFLQRFSRAYLTKNAHGGTEIVLVKEQGARGAGDASPGEAVQASSASRGPAVRQVMHVKVLWKPQAGTKQAHPSYTNAGLRWYVLADATRDGAAPEVLEYSGAGFVALTETAAGTQVTIKNATLKPVGTPPGSLTDPVGPARISGSFLAKKSARRANAVLAEVKTAMDGASTPHAAAE